MAAVTADLHVPAHLVGRDQEAPVVGIGAEHGMRVPLGRAESQAPAAGKTDRIAVVDRVDAIGIDVRQGYEPDASAAEIHGHPGHHAVLEDAIADNVRSHARSRPLDHRTAPDVRAFHSAGPAEVQVETPAPGVSAVPRNVYPVARPADAQTQPARRRSSRRRLEIEGLLHLARVERLPVLVDVWNDPLVD
jgi:hypothetical protein